MKRRFTEGVKKLAHKSKEIASDLNKKMDQAADRTGDSMEKLVKNSYQKGKEKVQAAVQAVSETELFEELGQIRKRDALKKRNAQLEAALNKYVDQIKKCKRVWITNEYVRKLDDEIWSAYYKAGGIRYYMRLLVENHSALGPEERTVRDISIRCYNTAVIPMCQKWSSMEAVCERWEKEIGGVEEVLSSRHGVCQTIGYTLCDELIDQLDTSGSDEIALGTLGRTLDANETALKEIVRRCRQTSDPQMIPLKNQELRETLRSMIGENDVLYRLEDPEKWEASEYIEAMDRIVQEIDENILQKYAVPGQISVKADEM